MYSKWKDQEVISLFNFIENGRKNNICLTNLFSSYAKQSKRKPNSVRNYYYAELNALQNDSKRRERLKIDLSVHKKIEPKEFSGAETEELVTKILEQTSKGISVRKACLNLANGDISKMVRYQNKFRTVLVQNKELYEKCLNKFKQNGEVSKKSMPNNVIAFKEKRIFLTDSDINSLFLGLVKLVKKQAGEEVNKSLKIEYERANDMLRRALVELSERENELVSLRKNFKVLSYENQKLSEEIKLLRCQKLKTQK